MAKKKDIDYLEDAGNEMYNEDETVMEETGAVEDIQPEILEEYPIELVFDPETLDMASYAGVQRKTRCWKDIVHENKDTLNEFIESLKKEYPECKTVSISNDIYEYLKIRVLREDIDFKVILIDETLEDNSIVLRN